MNLTKRLELRGLVVISILVVGSTTLLAQDEPGPLERLFHAMRRALNEPQHKSSHQKKDKQNPENLSPQEEQSNSRATVSGTSGTKAPPSEQNTRTTTRVTPSKGGDLRYGTPVAGKPGLVTSPYSPNSGYIDVRGFAPGTPVKDPYTGKIFLTP
jgi:hypothetical protein